ncbi:hypothetical protein V2W45_1342382 [Cenococcum geophilum]
MAHGYYYAVMGDYAVDIARAPQILFPGNRSLLALTTSDLQLLAKRSHFPDPSEEEITDKSKPMA